MLHRTQETHYKSAYIRFENEKKDSPVSDIIYTQDVSGSKESEQCYLINITIRLKKDHPDCDAVKKILLKKYIHMEGMQQNWEFEDYQINAKDLKNVVNLLGSTYLSESVFEELSKIKSLPDLKTAKIKYGLGFYSGNESKLKVENRCIKTPEEDSDWSLSCRIS